MKLTRVWAMPNAATFQIKPIQQLLARYVGTGKGWIDPFAGRNSPAELTNDINRKIPATFHLDALKFVEGLTTNPKGILFDPPYSIRQVSEHYQSAGRKASQLDTSANFYSRVMNAVCDNVQEWAISFGWNTNGFGVNRGFEIVEILIVAHGGRHNDTLCVVEKRTTKQDQQRRAQERQERLDRQFQQPLTKEELAELLS